MKQKEEVPVPFTREGNSFPEILRRLTEISLARELCWRPPKLPGRLGMCLAGHTDAPNQVGHLSGERQNGCWMWTQNLHMVFFSNQQMPDPDKGANW